jgi:hypothetical protein
MDYLDDVPLVFLLLAEARAIALDFAEQLATSMLLLRWGLARQRDGESFSASRKADSHLSL